jgi:hypothetical protein
VRDCSSENILWSGVRSALAPFIVLQWIGGETKINFLLGNLDTAFPFLGSETVSQLLYVWRHIYQLYLRIYTHINIGRRKRAAILYKNSYNAKVHAEPLRETSPLVVISKLSRGKQKADLVILLTVEDP